MKISKNKLSLAATAVAGALTLGMSATQEANASNWLMLQGTEDPGTVGRAQVWGFIQPEVQYTDGSEVPAGDWKGTTMQPNMIAPDLKSRATFNMRRARIGVRGQGFPLDNKVNYFILAEYGNNGISNKSKSVQLTDASITLNHIPHARVRVGQFKYPGSEEGLQAIHVFDYVNFTAFTDQMLLERFFDGTGSTAGDVNKPNGPVGAFRDIGVQVFDSMKTGGLETSYALMVGNGNGLNRTDNNGAKDYYAYLSTEKVFGGEGARREGLKGFIWHQNGKRTLTTDGAGEYDRKRTGLGATFRKDKYRAAFEYMWADGMIFNGTDGGAVAGNIATTADTTKATYQKAAGFNMEPEEKADGFYLDVGYKVLPKLELDLRYDVLHRATETEAKQRDFSTVTFGAQYFFNKKTRIVFNYEMRSQEVANPGAIKNANQRKAAETIADALDDRISVQMLAIF